MKKVLEEKRDKEKYEKAMAQIIKLEEKVISDFEEKNLKAAASDCEKIIEITNLIDKKDIADKYSSILEETKKELEARKAREKEKALEEKKSLKEKKAQEKAEALEEKMKLKEQKVLEKQKALEEKTRLKEQKALEKQKALEEKKGLKVQKALDQIAQLEEQIAINHEKGNLILVVKDCENLTKIAS